MLKGGGTVAHGTEELNASNISGTSQSTVESFSSNNDSLYDPNNAVESSFESAKDESYELIQRPRRPRNYVNYKE